MRAWETEFRRRVAEYVAPAHFVHGFMPDNIDWTGTDEESDPTYEDRVNPARVDLHVFGMCPCGQEISEYVEGPADITSLIRYITEGASALAGDAPADRVRDPFREHTTASRAAEEIEDSLDLIRHRHRVVFEIWNECCGCSNGDLCVSAMDESEATVLIHSGEDE